MDKLRASLEQRETSELASILRERDEEEWRPEVFPIVESILKARGADVAHLEVVTEEATEPEGDEPPVVKVATFPTEYEAKNASRTLDTLGVATWVTGGDAGDTPSYSLLVRAEDEESALAILNGEGPAELPEEIAEPPCPQCGSHDVRPVSDAVAAEGEGVPMHGGREVRQWFFECASCGHRWPDDTE